MEKLLQWMEEHFLPVAAKIGGQKHLVAIRDAFIGIMPVTMVGSVAVLLNVFLRDLPKNWGMTDFVESMQPIIGINGKVWWGSLAILSLVFIFSLGYNVAKAYDVNPLAGGVVAFSALITTLPEMAGDSWGYISVNYTGAAALFTALFVGLVSSLIYSKLMTNNITIKLPDSVPSAVSNAFAAIIPGVVAIYVVAIIGQLTVTYTDYTLHDLIITYIQKPVMGLSQGVLSVVLTSFLIQLFWFFGLHGSNIMGPVLDGVYTAALTENLEVYERTKDISKLPYIWTKASFDSYTNLGGSGMTLALIIAIFLFSKREDSKAIAKISAPMGIFNINEPITFGMPIVLNPIYVIPWLIVPPIMGAVAYTFTYIGVIPPTFIAAPWVMPAGFLAFIATGGNFMAALVALLNLVIAFLIWTPFVLLANRSEDL